MSKRESLLEEIETACKSAELNSEEGIRALSECIGSDEVIDYFIAQGSSPSFPNTLVDILVLTEKALYDCEMHQQGELRHILPLGTIVQISEGFAGEESEFLKVTFRISGLGGGLGAECRLPEAANLRRFSTAVGKKILERT